jgi:hypothetical protein
MPKIFSLENLKGRDHLEDLGVDGKVLEWMLGKLGGGCGLDSSGSGQGPVAGPSKHVNELSCSIKCGVFLH